MNQTRPELPPWIRTHISRGCGRSEVTRLLDGLQLNTVCQSARCPNQGACWEHHTATIMILGNRCTRNCRFCAIDAGKPLPPDPDEPARVADAVQRLDLGFVVLTSVDRDDLADKGAGHWCRTIQAVHKALPAAGVEVLTPDFMGEHDLVQQVIDCGPTVFNHNLETCERLSDSIRSANRYHRSLDVLQYARNAADQTAMAVKSGIMVGLGETDAEVEQTLRDMRAAGVDIVTIGQYLRPGREQLPVQRYVHPDRFAAWTELARGLGFRAVASAPLVRSSYKAAACAAAAGVFQAGAGTTVETPP